MNKMQRDHHVGFLTRFAISPTRSGRRAIYNAYTEIIRFVYLKILKRHTCLFRTTDTTRRPATRNDTSPHAWLEFRGFITVGLRATEARRKAIGECTVCRGTRLSADRRGLRYRSERKTQSIGMPLRRTLTSSRASSKKGSWQYASVLELCWTSRSFCLKYGGYEQWKD